MSTNLSRIFAGFFFLCLLGPSVFGNISFAPGDNLALNGTATASTAFDNLHEAGAAIDDDTNGNFTGVSLFSSQNTSQPWWELDLGQVSNISDIIIFRRSDGSTAQQNRLEDALLFVAETPFSSNDPAVLQNDANVTTVAFSSPVANPSSFTLNISGRYIRIQLTGADYLQLAEVQVIEGDFSCPPDEVSGIVFHDLDGDGLLTNSESGLDNITVSLYDASGLFASNNTAADGSFSFSGLDPGANFRLEFTNLPAGMAFSPYSANGSGTSVRFLAAGTCLANLGLNFPEDYCHNNPDLATTCFVDGDPLSGGTSGTTDAFVSFPYVAFGNDTSVINKMALNSEIGSTWGVAYKRTTKEIFVATVLKRHVGLGPMGLGGIYVINNNDPANPVVDNWLNLNTLSGVSVGTNPRNYSLPADAGVSSNDVAVFDNIGKTGIGDIDISDDDKTLYVINLQNQELLVIDIETKALIGNIAITNPGCGVASDVRPWALKVHHDEVYVGLVCTGESAGANDLQFFVMRLNGNNFDIVFNESLDYPKGNVHNEQAGLCNVWQTWATNFDDIHLAGVSPLGIRICRPQPVLADIEFDDAGNMILGFMDRTGMQTGYQQRGITGTSLYSGYIGGDILKVYNSNGSYVLESAGTTPGGGGCGANGQGPGGGEYFCDETLYWDNDNDGIPEEIHQETVMGSLAYLSGSDEIVVNVMDPFVIWEGGTSWMNNTTGRETRAFTLYVTTGSFNNMPGTGGKSIGLGDIELLCNPAPLEIGNYVWLDENVNGIQDPGEPGIDSVTINLYLADGTLVGTTVSANGGQYFFNDNNVNLNNATRLEYYTDYVIAINNTADFSGGYLAAGGETYGAISQPGNSTSGMADYRDSDALDDGASGIAAVASFPYIALTTGGPGEVNHSFEFGFTPSCPVVIDASGIQEVCSGDTLLNLMVRTSAQSPSAVTFVYFNSAQTVADDIYANGTILGTTPIPVNTDTVTLSDIVFPENTGITVQRYYVYAILEPVPDEVTCRPFAELLVDVNPLPIADAGPDGEMCPGGTLPLSASGGVSYTWNPIMGLINPNSGSTITTIANSMIYTVEVTDANGCVATDDVLIKVKNGNVCLPAQFTKN